MWCARTHTQTHTETLKSERARWRRHSRAQAPRRCVCVRGGDRPKIYLAVSRSDVISYRLTKDATRAHRLHPHRPAVDAGCLHRIVCVRQQRQNRARSGQGLVFLFLFPIPTGSKQRRHSSFWLFYLTVFEFKRKASATAATGELLTHSWRTHISVNEARRALRGDAPSPIQPRRQSISITPRLSDQGGKHAPRHAHVPKWLVSWLKCKDVKGTNSLLYMHLPRWLCAFFVAADTSNIKKKCAITPCVS